MKTISTLVFTSSDDAQGDKKFRKTLPHKRLLVLQHVTLNYAQQKVYISSSPSLIVCETDIVTSIHGDKKGNKRTSSLKFLSSSIMTPSYPYLICVTVSIYGRGDRTSSQNTEPTGITSSSTLRVCLFPFGSKVDCCHTFRVSRSHSCGCPCVALRVSMRHVRRTG